MSGITDLIERLEKAEGPDREVDAHILVATDDRPAWTIDYGPLWADDQGIVRVNNLHPRKPSSGNPSIADVPTYTASLDAATALVARLLPGWGWDVASNTEHIKACLNPEFGTPVGRHPHWAAVANTSSKLFHDGATPAIAVCLALLRALQQEDRR